MGDITRQELDEDLNNELNNFMPLDASADITEIKTNVGNNADVASATGSVHAKLKDIKSSVGTSGQKLFKKPYGAGTNGTINLDINPHIVSPFNIFSDSGEGMFVDMTFYANAVSTYPIIRITVDGVLYPVGHMQPTGGGYWRWTSPVYFSSSILVQVETALRPNNMGYWASWVKV